MLLKTILEKLLKSSFAICIRWIFIASFTGLVAGGIGVLFHFVLEWAQETRHEYAWLLYLLPVGGVIIAVIYHFIGHDRVKGTDMALTAIRENKEIPVLTAPLIFASTAITHLFGGSAGREGAALQLGSSIAHALGRQIRLNEKDERVITMCGMAAAFSALFGTPITATIFALEVTSVGVMYYAAIVPCTIASIVGFMLALYCGIEPVAFPFIAEVLSSTAVLKVIVLGLLCAALSYVFWAVMHKTHKYAETLIKNTYLRPVIGGCAIIVLTLIIGHYDYNGAGMDVITRALDGSARYWDFIMKIIFTAITLSTGFKGGEIVPTFFVGATFGCVVGPLLGLPAAFAAALGLVAVFCGVTNCPLTSIILGVELFGSSGLIFYCLVCAVCYMTSGYFSLYSEQRIIYSKISAERHF